MIKRDTWVNPAPPNHSFSLWKGGVKAAASFFYIGYLPIMPGTYASLAGLLLAWFLRGTLLYWTLGFFAVGLFISKPAQELFQNKDPQRFVLDEVCGMMLSVLWLPANLWIFLAGFLLFRLLDGLKPWPIYLLERSRSFWNIMADDVAAGLITNFILQAFIRLAI